MYERAVTRHVEETHPGCAEMFNKSNCILQEFFPFLKFYVMTAEYACLLFELYTDYSRSVGHIESKGCLLTLGRKFSTYVVWVKFCKFICN